MRLLLKILKIVRNKAREVHQKETHSMSGLLFIQELFCNYLRIKLSILSKGPGHILIWQLMQELTIDL